MIWFGVAIAIALLVWVFLSFYEALGVLFVTALVAFVLNLFFMSVGTQSTLINSYPLVAIKQTTGLTGSFFLFSGSVDTKAAYRYYERHSDGAMTLEDASTYDSKIYYTKEVPRVDEYNDVKSSRLWSLFSADLLPTKKFYVPEGSITRDISLAIK